VLWGHCRNPGNSAGCAIGSGTGGSAGLAIREVRKRQPKPDVQGVDRRNCGHDPYQLHRLLLAHVRHKIGQPPSGKPTRVGSYSVDGVYDTSTESAAWWVGASYRIR